MGIGIALGGAAKGLESAEDTFASKRKLDIQRRGQDLDAERLRQTEQRNLMTEADRAISSHMKAASNIITEGRKNGAPPEKIKAAIQPLLDDVQSLSRGAGRDGALAITQVEAMLGAPMTGAGGLQFKGTGMQQQSANVLMEIARKREQGLPVTAEDKRAYSLAYGELTVPKVVGSPSTGYSFVQNTLDPNVFPSPEGLDTPMRREPQVGQEVSPFGNELESPVSPASPAQPQPGPGARITPLSEPTKPQSADQAGRGALVSQGAVNATRVRDAIVNPDGSVNRDIVFSMSSDIPLLGKGLPGTEGRGVRSVLEDALASKLRLETGAQANAEELQNIIDRFMPSMLDDDATVRDKMKRLADYFGEALSKTDPALADKLISRAREDGNVPEPPPDESGAVFTGFDASSGVAVFKRPNGTFFGVAQRGRR